MVYGRLKLDLKVISGLEEARLIWTGVKANLNLGNGPSLVMDIGGGSVELIVDQSGCLPLFDSLPLGSARLSGRFGLINSNEAIGPTLYDDLKRYVRTRASHFLAEAKERRMTRCWGCSGTLENLASVWNKKNNNDSGEAKPVPISQLTKLGHWLGEMNLETRRQTPGLDQDKASMIVAGCAVADAVMSELGIEEFEAVPYGLKHGLIQEFAVAFGARPLDGYTRLDSVRRLGRRCLYDEKHAEAVAKVATMVYDAFAVRGLILKDEGDRELVGYAGLLHDIGKFLSYDSHQTHGWYLVRNASLLGFVDDELELVAYLVLSHRGPKRLKKNQLSGLQASVESVGQGRRIHWPKLGLFVWLAELLESRRQGAVKGLELKLSGRDIRFELLASQGSSLDDEMCSLKKTGKQIENLFGLNLVGIEATKEDGS
jgi:exopolyphosphatase/guanosine-5'-triphosphate,3'-diphosphate pyrophosphatase